jgi:hypothetical protein
MRREWWGRRVDRSVEAAGRPGISVAGGQMGWRTSQYSATGGGGACVQASKARLWEDGMVTLETRPRPAQGGPGGPVILRPATKPSPITSIVVDHNAAGATTPKSEAQAFRAEPWRGFTAGMAPPDTARTGPSWSGAPPAAPPLRRAGGARTISSRDRLAHLDKPRMAEDLATSVPTDERHLPGSPKTTEAAAVRSDGQAQGHKSAPEGMSPVLGRVLASGSVNAERWMPFGTRPGRRDSTVPEAFIFSGYVDPSSAENGSANIVDRGDRGHLRVRRPFASGMRIGGPYDWALHAGEDGEPDILAIKIRLRVIRDAGASAEDVAQVRRAVTEVFDTWVNHRRVLLPEFQPEQLSVGGGSSYPSAILRWRLHITLELIEGVDFSKNTHGTVAIRPGEPTSEEPMRQGVWYAGMGANSRKRVAFIHEGLHWLGVLDEKHDPRIMFASPSAVPAQRLPNGHISVMGSHKEAHPDDSFVITDDHLEQILEVARPYLTPTPRVIAPSRLSQKTQGLVIQREENPLAAGVDVQPPVDWARVLDSRGNIVEVKPQWVYRSYEVGPDQVFIHGLSGRDRSRPTTVELHWKTTGKDQYVSTTTDVTLHYKSRRWLYHIRPSDSGIDVAATMEKQSINYYLSWEKEVIFTDHIPASDIHGCKDMTTGVYHDNPSYRRPRA